MNGEVKRIVDALKYIANSKTCPSGIKSLPKWIVDNEVYLEDLAGMAADMLEKLQARCEAAERDMKLIADMDAADETLPCILCAKNNKKCDVSDTCFEWCGPREE